MQIVIDSNEHAKGKAWKFKESCRVMSLVKYGCDYSVYGYFGLIGIERKAWPDYCRCLGTGWKAFLKQMYKLASNRYNLVIVEGNINDYILPRFTKVRTSTVIYKTALLSSLGVKILFAGSKQNAQQLAYNFLKFATKRIRNAPES